MLKAKKASFVCLILFTIFFLESCKSKKTVTTKNIPGKSALKILDEMQNNSLNYQWLSIRANVSATFNKKNQQFKANIRVKKDSVIWVSVMPALGIEAARIYLTPDSAFFVDKIYNRYFAGTYKNLSERINAEIDYFIIQDLIEASPVDYDRDAVYTLTEDSNDYLLTTVGTRKIRKALLFKEKNFEDAELDTTLNTMVNPKKEKKLDRALQKVDEERLYLRKYKIDKQSMLLYGSFLNDLKSLSILEVNYTNYIAVEDGNALYPSEAGIYLSNNEAEINIELGLSKVRLNTIQNLNFNIPKKYERIF